LHATRAAVEKGIVPGGGAALARASLILPKIKANNDDQRFGIEVLLGREGAGQKVRPFCAGGPGFRTGFARVPIFRSCRTYARCNHTRGDAVATNRFYAIMPNMGGIYSDHNRLDERSLAMHELIVEKVRTDPALLDKARDNVRRWQQIDGSPMLALAEWEQILDGPVNEVTQFLTERSDRAARLRQSSPFAGMLTEAERRTVYESYSTRTRHPGRQPNLG
jgi:hypothetical protein